jgi:F0F1-type ATP synthase membrane subunit a
MFMMMFPTMLAEMNPMEDVLPHVYHRYGTFHFPGLGPIPPFDQPIILTNHMIMAMVASILMLIIFPTLFSKVDAEAPTGAKNFFESILEFLRVEVFRPALKEHTDRFLPFLWTLFFFILFCNVLGTIPFATIFELISGGRIEHLGGAATGNISTTAALAICAFLFIHFNGLSQIVHDLRNGTYGHHGTHNEHSSNGDHGHEAAIDLDHMRGDALAADVPQDFRALGNPSKHYQDDVHPDRLRDSGHSAEVHGKGVSLPVALVKAPFLYLWNFAPHPFQGKPLMDVPMWAVLLVLELVGACIKPIALCLRLFGNMVAGHVLLAVLIGLIVMIPAVAGQIAIGAPVGILDVGIQLLEVFVAFLQAYIFTFLTTLFIASAIAPEH